MTPAAIDTFRSTLRDTIAELRQVREELGAKLSNVAEMISAFEYDHSEALDNEASPEMEALLDVLQEIVSDADTARECLEELEPACC